ncbi:hypothetical protein A0H81_08889 [Grifola frondosa]|uniref:Uncharacterized protein n=1 Tax=Grifola frondosa TaxID=5627 RepID=A0A1C7M361_GRIFR|nr:hypothetical protein A0H81_08889 [Grifola frondosa]
MSINIENAISSLIQSNQPVTISNVITMYLYVTGSVDLLADEASHHQAVIAFEHAMDKYPMISCTEATILKTRLYSAEVSQLRRQYWKEVVGNMNGFRCQCESCGQYYASIPDDLDFDPVNDESSSETRKPVSLVKRRKKRVVRPRYKRPTPLLVDLNTCASTSTSTSTPIL